jgi:hypothetical protein
MLLLLIRHATPAIAIPTAGLTTATGRSPTRAEDPAPGERALGSPT